MSAEAKQWYEPDLASPPPSPTRRRSSGRRPAAMAERPRRQRSNQEESWNVLTEQLVSFPRPGRHTTAEPVPGAQAHEGPVRGEDVAKARSYGEEWLRRELRTIRYLADAGYPSLPRDSLVRSDATGAQGWTEGSSALAPPLPRRDDDFVTAPERSRPARPLRGRPAEGTRPVPRPVPVPRRSLGELATEKPHRASESSRGLRRLLPGVATLAALAGIWVGAAALSATHDRPLTVLPGSAKVAGGYSYVVRPGDTIWSIASRLDPGGDPRPLVARLESQLHGRSLQPGMKLLVP